MKELETHDISHTFWIKIYQSMLLCAVLIIMGWGVVFQFELSYPESLYDIIGRVLLSSFLLCLFFYSRYRSVPFFRLISRIITPTAFLIQTYQIYLYYSFPDHLKQPHELGVLGVSLLLIFLVIKFKHSVLFAIYNIITTTLVLYLNDEALFLAYALIGYNITFLFLKYQIVKLIYSLSIFNKTANERAQRHSFSKFSSRISHRINNELMKISCSTNDEIVHSSINRINEAIIQLNRFDIQDLPKSDVNIHELLTDLSYSYKDKIQIDGYANMRGNPEQLRTAFTYLIDNATIHGTSDLVKIKIKPDYVSISNKGKPIEISNIFDPFISSEDVHTHDGIGLTLAKQLLSINDASISHEYHKQQHIFLISFSQLNLKKQ